MRVGVVCFVEDQGGATNTKAFTMGSSGNFLTWKEPELRRFCLFSRWAEASQSWMDANMAHRCVSLHSSSLRAGYRFVPRLRQCLRSQSEPERGYRADGRQHSLTS